MFWGLSWNVEVPQKILAEINENVDIITVSKLNRIQTYYDVIVYDETIPISGLDEKSLIDNPIIEILETPLRGNLYLVNIKEAKKLISQAEFRTSLKNSGFFREKIPIMKTMNFIFLQMFHEKTQTRQYLDIYRKIWEGWHHELTKALSWSTGQIVKGGMTQLSSIYSDASRLELFFAGQFADMNLQVKLEELSKTLLYHLYLTSLSGSSISILIDDLDLETSEIKLEKLKILTEESSFLEYIDPKLFMNSMAEKIDLETEYSSFRELHENLEKMLQSVQDISQTKQQRWITIALVVFSVTEMTLAFLEVFK